jgi:uncharacterized protein YecE (DUF72 family)
MEFGKVDNIDKVDYTFPHDHPDTTKLLHDQQKKKGFPRVYVGCAKWGRPDWIGKIYPKGTKATDFLKHYTTFFNTIELNAMFYQTFPKTVTEKWASYADDDFRFCPKMSQYITHIKRLKGTEDATDKFLDSLSGFGHKIGHSFIQFDDRFGTNNLDTLKAYLEYLPKDFKVCVEFRHPDWFKDSIITRDAFEMLRQMKVGTVITDTSGRRDVLHMRLTTPVAFIRYVGNNLDPTDYARIDHWVARIKHWVEAGVETVYFFIHNHEEANSPIMAKYAVEKFNAAMPGLNLTVPKLLDDKPTLFK